jgi:effector-binding domain-containing protein
MKRTIRTILAAAIILIGVMKSMAIEEAPYKVLKSSDKFELREYAPHILAETIVDGDQEGAGNKAFRRLFRYISGDNRSRTKVAMTAPVSQEKAGEKISMTAPVGQQREGDKWAVSFTMPSSYTLETLPAPDDPLITLRQVPARRMAAVRYSGFWSEGNYRDNLKELQEWVRSQGLTATGEPVWARYDPPWTLWFLRRNEILILVTSGAV